jgi:hypothetical protein
MTRFSVRLSCSVFALLPWLAACDDKPKPSGGPAPASSAPAPSAAASAEPSARPEVAVDGLGAKLGFSRILLERTEGQDRLHQELGQQRAAFAGKEVTVSADRAAKIAFVARVIDELGALSVGPIRIKTETRKEFAGELEFSPLAQNKAAKDCSVVAMILADRATAVWKLSGGVATKRARGFAGPDLTMTGDTLERFGKACKDSAVLFVSAAPDIEWGLVFDLAASAKGLSAAHFERFVVLAEPPIAGRRVKL